MLVFNNIRDIILGFCIGSIVTSWTCIGILMYLDNDKEIE